MLPGELKFKKDTKVVLTFSNPANTNTKIQFLQAEPSECESGTAKVRLLSMLLSCEINQFVYSV
jgi:hypothetical protein